MKLTAGSASAAASGTVWDRVAACESGGNWSINTGNGYYGGLQFSAQTWLGFGGGKYARYANQATKAQQIAIAQKVLRVQGPGAWPVCSRRAGLTVANGTAVQVGTRLVAVIEVDPIGAADGRLIVTDPLPAGFEIDNPNLLSQGEVEGLDWLGDTSDTDMAEFRQDRFLTAIDRYNAETFRLAYIVRAVSPGEFHHPAASVEDMYRPERRAWTDSGTTVVTP
mgnify:CR=1 FL=1